MTLGLLQRGYRCSRVSFVRLFDPRSGLSSFLFPSCLSSLLFSSPESAESRFFRLFIKRGGAIKLIMPCNRARLLIYKSKSTMCSLLPAFFFFPLSILFRLKVQVQKEIKEPKKHPVDQTLLTCNARATSRATTAS